MPTIPIHIQPGRLPPFWERSAIYFANLPSLFYGNEGETHELMEMVGGIQSYGGRLLPILNLVFRGDNLLVLEQKPDDHLTGYFKKDLNLALPEIMILSHRQYLALAETQPPPPGSVTARALSRLDDHPALWVDGFVVDEVLERIAPLLGKRTLTTCEGSKQGNNKLLLHQFLETRQWDRFDTHIARTRKQVPQLLRALDQAGYARAALKSQIGASGIGMMRLDTRQAHAASIPDHFFYEGPCLVQGWLDETMKNVRRIGSPSVQLFLSDDGVYLFDLTEQILSNNSVHEGNLAFPPYLRDEASLKNRILEQGGRIGQWLHGKGYRGTASSDFLIVERGDDVSVITCELNARITGATYPSVLARHFRPEGSWLMRNLKLRTPMEGVDLLALLDKAGYLYHREDDSGILPINFNADDTGQIVKGQFLFLADEADDCMQLLLDAETVLPVKWTYDRD